MPSTSKLKFGFVTPIPTFPEFVNIFPIVFESPIADKCVVILAIPAVKLVSTKLVVVIFTTVRVPATLIFPETYIAVSYTHLTLPTNREV